MPERRDPLADLRGRPVLDVILELVDLVVQIVDQVEVALGDLVDEAEREHADVLLRPACLLGRLRVERLLVGRRLRDRHEPVGGQDEVDLLVEDGPRRAPRPRSGGCRRRSPADDPRRGLIVDGASGSGRVESDASAPATGRSGRSSDPPSVEASRGCRRAVGLRTAGPRLRRQIRELRSSPAQTAAASASGRGAASGPRGPPSSAR